jgi:hypothetical protein
VIDWTTPAQHFPWTLVQEALDARDPNLGAIPMLFAQEYYAAQADPCPSCGRQPEKRTWCSVDDPDEVWAAGHGRCGFLTFCPDCKLQVDFFVDDELTRMRQADEF